MLSKQEIAGMRELLAKATQYPAWGGWPDPQPSRHGTDHYTIGDASPYIAAVRRKEDADLIAAMHRALPALLDIAEAVANAPVAWQSPSGSVIQLEVDVRFDGTDTTGWKRVAVLPLAGEVA
jgi:hypothetical protein